MKTITTVPMSGTRIDGRPLRNGQFVPLAASLARRPTLQQLENTESLARLYSCRDQLVTSLSRALPIEGEMVDASRKQLKQVDRSIAWLEKTPEFDLPIVDPRFLSWKTHRGFPAFSIFRPQDATGRIQINLSPRRSFRRAEDGARTWVHVAPQLPEILAQPYLDEGLHRNLGLICRERNFEKLSIVAEYGGVMPAEVREKIHFWQNRSLLEPHFDEIFIIAEAPDDAWEMTGVPRKDPLVVGIAHDLVWLIAAYDLTPVERFVKDVFAGEKCQLLLN